MNVLSLFSGIGLLDIGLEWAGMRTVGLCEIDAYGQAVLRKHWPGVPLWSDVREVTGDAVRERCGAVDLVAGGFPCQPHSVAGKRKGREDERHLWPEFARVVREVRPRWVLAENVPGLRTTAADEVLSDLEAEGYSCWPLVVGADDGGAPHRRKRVWSVGRLGLADGDGERERDADELRREQRAGGAGTSDAGGGGEVMGHPSRLGAGRVRNADGLPEPRLGSAGPGAALGEPTGAGLEIGRGVPEPASATQPEHPRPGDPTLLRGWPARPGEPQREWEAPRIAEPGLGGAVDGSARRLDGIDAPPSRPSETVSSRKSSRKSAAPSSRRKQG